MSQMSGNLEYSYLFFFYLIGFQYFIIILTQETLSKLTPKAPKFY